MGNLDQDGFEIIADIVDIARISSVLRAIESSEVPRSRAGMRRAMEIAAVRDIAHDPQIVSFATRTLGPGAVPFRATLFDKSPDQNWLVVWHQDTALPVRSRIDTPGWGPWSMKEGTLCAHAPESALSSLLAIRLNLDESIVENGAIRALPATHTLGVLSDDSIRELANQITPVECHVGIGGVMLMRPLLVHASSKLVRGRRRVLHIEYAAQTHFGNLEIALPSCS